MDKLADFLRRRVEIRSKVWLETEGRPLIGSGRAQLLRTVERTGSISAAARELKMDYHRAWGLIDSMEKRMRFRLVVRHRGGSDKGTILTEEAHRLLDLYERLAQHSQESADRRFRAVFKRQEKEQCLEE